MRRSIPAGAIAGLLLLGPLAAGARADQTIRAVFPSQYANTDVTIDQGERLTFQNFDVVEHDVTATSRGPDGQTLFASPLIGTGEDAFVERSQYLTTGEYGYVCSIHANMTGTLRVTSAGTPVPRPRGGGGSVAGDKTRPRVSVSLRSTRASRVRRARQLLTEVSVNEAAKVALVAKARSKRRRVTIATGAVELTGAGTRRRGLRVTRAGRRLLKGKRRLAVTITARAVDSAGNVGTASARGRLRR